jgi:hypothetical protein
VPGGHEQVDEMGNARRDHGAYAPQIRISAG